MGALGPYPWDGAWLTPLLTCPKWVRLNLIADGQPYEHNKIQ